MSDHVSNIVVESVSNMYPYVNSMKVKTKLFLGLINYAPRYGDVWRNEDIAPYF
jgi:hypothetical protein